MATDDDFVVVIGEGGEKGGEEMRGMRSDEDEVHCI